MTYRLEPYSHDIERDLRPTVAVIADGPLHVTGRDARAEFSSLGPRR
jgi:hypothetical protein